MSSAPENAVPPPLRQPTLFISYASEDREAARRLRDTLTAAGLDVWYDENELGGGDAWDQKIRQQIRECDFFMPVISATTERRKEGYFRREWRLAAERTLDMADDVTFLLPVTIDGTSEAGARVPDKFFAVQWLRLPEGRPTPALEALCRRLASGDHSTRPPARPVPLPRARPAGPAPAVPAAGPAPSEGPPPMPPFPHVPEKGGFGHGLKFVAEAFWWVVTAGWLLFKRAPKWLRLLLSLWLAFAIVSRCGSSRERAERESSPPKPPKVKTIDSAQLKKVIESATAPAKDGNPDGPTDYLAIGTKIAQGIAAGLKDVDSTGKPLLIVPFEGTPGDEAQAKQLAAVFAPLYGRLALDRAGDIAAPAEKPVTAGDATLLEIGHKLTADYVLGGWINVDNGTTVLVVHLVEVEGGATKWSGQFALDFVDSAPADVADQIATAVLAAVPKS